MTKTPQYQVVYKIPAFGNTRIRISANAFAFKNAGNTNVVVDGVKTFVPGECERYGVEYPGWVNQEFDITFDSSNVVAPATPNPRFEWTEFKIVDEAFRFGEKPQP